MSLWEPWIPQESTVLPPVTIRELACPESCTLLDSHSTIPGRSLGLPTDDLVALLAGGGGTHFEHKATSSDEDNDIESVDTSLTEADHPLHDSELLGSLLYTEQLKVRIGFQKHVEECEGAEDWYQRERLG